MNETYGVKGGAHKLEQRNALASSLSELSRLASLSSLFNFNVEFSPSGQVLQITNYNFSGSSVGTEHFAYDQSGKLIRSIKYDEAGSQVSITDFEFQNEESRIATTRNPEGELLGRILNTYEGGRLLSFVVHDERDRLKGKKTFLYAAGKLVSSDSRHYLPDGAFCEQGISLYDSEGRIASTYGLNGEGQPLGDGKYKYEYDGEGRESRVWSFNEFANDDVPNAVRVYEYETDYAGNWVERREFFALRGDSHWTKHVTTRRLTYYKT